MKAIVLADRLGEELQPLCDWYCAALLPVAGKPVLQYTLEELAEAGFSEAVVVVSADAEQIERTIGDGSRWGMRLEYFLSRGEESPRQLLRRIGIKKAEECLLLRGDVLRGYVLQEFLDAARRLVGCYVEGRIIGGVTAFMLCREPGDYLVRIGWPLALSSSPLADGGRLQLLRGKLARLDSLSDYHAANLQAVKGLFPGILMSGHKVRPGLRVAAQTRVNHLQFSDTCVVLGENVFIDPSVSLHGDLVIGDESVIGAGTSISDSVVMPGTCVGTDLDICNAIVAPELLIRVDTGVVVSVDDPMILADLQQAEAGDYLRRLANRFAGVLLLLLSIPLWPLAAAMAAFADRHNMLTVQRVIGNQMLRNSRGGRRRLAFADWQWNVSAPVLRGLPRLLAVTRGHLNLFGLRARPVDVTGSGEAARFGRDGAVFGLIGPAQVELPPDAPLEEVNLNEAWFSAQRNWKANLRYIALAARALLSRRAWCASCTGRPDLTNIDPPKWSCTG